RLYTGFCNDDESDYLDTVATDISAIRINGLGRSISPVADFKAFIHLIKEIREFRPHVIHTHTAKAGVVGRIASLLSGRRSVRVHTFHGHLLHGYFGKFKTSLVIVVEKSLASFTHRLLAVGERVMKDLLEAGIGSVDKFSVMSPGLELETLPSREFARLELGLDPTQIYCAFIGRITHIKRPDRFLDVVAALKKEGVALHFVVAGDGQLLEECKSRVTKDSLSVTFLGWRSDIETILAASDMVVLTSDNEGTPLCLIQAGMAHLPVVSTRVGSVPEIIADGETGFVVDLSVEALAEALSTLVQEATLRSEMGIKAYEYTMARYGVARLVKDHQDLYVKLLNDRAKS
ncbi:MAG: glycosyltransferase, partial [Actinobacteria bacterium]|nr:glycosyltransferase [Actinomycetota bacterium]